MIKLPVQFNRYFVKALIVTVFHQVVNPEWGKITWKCRIVKTIPIMSISNFAPLAGFLLGVIYTIGLITVTIHLNRYGITNVYLVQTKYLVVGTVFMIHISGLAILAAPAVLLLTQILGINGTGYVSSVLGILGLFVILVSSYYADSFETLIQRITRRFAKLTPPMLLWRI